MKVHLQSITKKLAHFILALELPVLALLLYAFWHHSPIRDRWLWLLWLPLLLVAARWIAHRRLWTRTPLDIFLLLFLLLGVINVRVAPYTRGYLMLARPLLGMALVIGFVEHARSRRKMDILLGLSVVLGLVVGLLGLLATQWTVKGDTLTALTAYLPAINHEGFLPDALLSFNPNEIAGTMAWLVPLAAGLAFNSGSGFHDRSTTILRRVAGIAFVLLFSALFLGQSRFALGGTLLALIILTLLLTPGHRARYGRLLVIAAFGVLELVIIFNLLGPTTTPSLTTRDQDSLSKRTNIWNVALQIVGEYPLTGAGMSMYREATREDYPVVGFEGRSVPHAHNEWLQIATDLGFPGLIVYGGWQTVIGIMLYQCWKHGDGNSQVVALSVAGGLVAHAIFGLGDATPLWDRFAFVYWWLVGLVCAQYVLVRGTVRKP